MNRTTVVYGPPASGKTRHAEQLRKLFGCSQIIDGWESCDGLTRDALHLTSEFDFTVSQTCMVIPIDKALQALRTNTGAQ